jgi:DNA-binding transcriptional regulator YiaG
MRGEALDIAKTIKELRESTGMTRNEFSKHTGIPVRTLEDWEAARRTPPEYIPRLIAYQLKYEELMQENTSKEELDGEE